MTRFAASSTRGVTTSTSEAFDFGAGQPAHVVIRGPALRRLAFFLKKGLGARMPLAARQQRLIEELGIIPDRQERLAIIVDRARNLPRFDATQRTNEHAVRGCLSPVWVIASSGENGTLHFRCDAESPLVKGLVAFLCEFYSGAPAKSIVSTEPLFLDELGLIRDLSPTRRNGLAAVRRRIRELAAAIAVSSDSSAPS